MPPPTDWLPFLEDAYRARTFSNFGPVATRLENALTAKYALPGRRAVLVSNCTVGLTAVLLALRVRGPVIVPAFTFPATAQAVLQANCQPVFGDVARETWELDLARADELIGRHDAAAVIHVRAFGFCHDVSALHEICRRRGVPLIVDAAAALGGKLSDQTPAGNQGDAEVFSLHATKVFGIGEGGVIFAPEPMVDSIRRAVNFGLAAGDVLQPGMNGKLTEVHAAIGLAVLDRIDGFIARRQGVVAEYLRRLDDEFTALLPAGRGAAPWPTFPVLLPPGVHSARVADALRQFEIESRCYYHPALHETTVFRSDQTLIHSEHLARHMLCLPVYSDMTAEEAECVVDAFPNAVTLARQSKRLAA
jgi:dTDP-4-amino-4,6-dideoxygalactose transaminase